MTTQAAAVLESISPTARYTNCLPLAAVPTAVVLARHYVRHVLRQWNLSVLNDTAELVVSELTTNAIKVTGSIERPRYSDWANLTTIVVCVYRNGPKVIIEVWDRDRRPPERKAPSADDENGRGLLLVEMLCSNWGYRWPAGGGKIVWAELTAE